MSLKKFWQPLSFYKVCLTSSCSVNRQELDLLVQLIFPTDFSFQNGFETYPDTNSSFFVWSDVLCIGGGFLPAARHNFRSLLPVYGEFITRLRYDFAFFPDRRFPCPDVVLMSVLVYFILEMFFCNISL